MAFIVDLYNRYDGWDRTHSVYKFEINGQWYAIKKVEMEWGTPRTGYRVDQEQAQYQVYESEEEARKFVEYMKKLAR